MSILTRKFNQIKKEENKIRSIDLVKQINLFRKQEAEILEKDLSKVKEVRNYDFDKKISKYNKVVEKIDKRKISFISYFDSMNRKRKTYLLTKHEAMIFAAGESDLIKAMVISHMENIELELKIALSSTEHTKETHDKLYDVIKEHKFDSVNSEYSKINTFINMSTCKILGLNQKELTKKDMTPKQLEIRAEIEEKWIKYYKGKKSGIKAKIEKELI